MKWPSLFKFFRSLCRGLGFLLLALPLLLGVATFVFDRIVAAEVPRAFPKHAVIADAQLRRGIQEVFPFHPSHSAPVFEVFEQEHPDLVHFLGRGVARGLVAWCVYLHESSRLDASAGNSYFFDKDDEILQGLDAASRHWLHHGIESATVDELQVLKGRLTRNNREASRRHDAKHPPGDGV